MDRPALGQFEAALVTQFGALDARSMIDGDLVSEYLAARNNLPGRIGDLQTVLAQIDAAIAAASIRLAEVAAHYRTRVRIAAATAALPFFGPAFALWNSRLVRRTRPLLGSTKLECVAFAASAVSAGWTSVVASGLEALTFGAAAFAFWTATVYGQPAGPAALSACGCAAATCALQIWNLVELRAGIHRQG